MSYRLLSFPLFALLLSAMTLMSAADSPESGYVGTLFGTVVSTKSTGKTITLSVTKADPERKAVLGTQVTIKTRLRKTVEGEWVVEDGDMDFVKSIGPGSVIVVPVAWNGKLNDLRVSADMKRQ